MTIQITVRLADELVAYIDSQDGSRASVVERALRREIRRARAAQDAEILAAWPAQPDDLDQLAEYAARQPLDLD